MHSSSLLAVLLSRCAHANALGPWSAWDDGAGPAPACVVVTPTRVAAATAVMNRRDKRRGRCDIGKLPFNCQQALFARGPPCHTAGCPYQIRKLGNDLPSSIRV